MAGGNSVHLLTKIVVFVAIISLLGGYPYMRDAEIAQAIE